MRIIRHYIKKMLKTWDVNDKKILDGQTYPDGITELTDIPYMNDSLKSHLLDIYYPEAKDELLPVMINIHGGGFVYGRKELNKSFCCHLAKRGFIVFNINYRLALYDAKIPDQIQDVMSAVQWIYECLDDYKADKDKIYMTGDSAGAMLAIMAVLISNSKRLQKIYKIQKSTISFKGLALISGLMNIDNPDIKYKGLRSVIFARGYKKQEYYQNMILERLPELNKLPPVYLISSEEDELNYMTLDFVKVLGRHNVKYKLKYYSKGENSRLGHIFCVQYPEYSESIEFMDEMIEFFSEE